ncbi:MAG: hypothetical protein ACFHVJ_02095 [Aestuariibacter sp.]
MKNVNKVLPLKLFFCTLALILASLDVSAKELKWYISDFFPCHILHGALKGTGFCDEVLSHLQRALPQYQHSIEPVVLSKLVSSPDVGEQFCTLQLLKTEKRQTRFNFTDYFLEVDNNGIFIRASDTRFEPFMVNEYTISLTRLFQDYDLILARDTSRVYGAVIDDLISGAATKVTQVLLNSDAKYAELLKNGRIDYTIAYPTELHDLVTGSVPAELKFLEIEEPQPRVFAHASCSKLVNKQVLNDINAVILKHRDSVFIEFYQRWLPPVNR